MSGSSISRTELAEALTVEAKRLGAAAIGFASAGPCQSAAHFAAWLEAGYHAEMTYLVRHRMVREHPENLLPQIRTIIVITVRTPAHPQPGEGFSSIAWGYDYHTVVRSILQALSNILIQRAPEERHRLCVDSAPLSEREWAERAGIGWRGRQGQIISADAGACLVLGELLTTVELLPGKTSPPRCGRCRRCLDICPTQALLPDGTLDARRCISYLTIEHPGPIPHELRPMMGHALFGCDRCTAICPWNRFGVSSIHPDLRPTIPLPDALECLKMTEEDFAVRFRNTSIYRSGLNRLRRNASVVLGNSRNRSYLKILENLATHEPDPVIREHIQWAIARIQNPITTS